MRDLFGEERQALVAVLERLPDFIDRINAEWVVAAARLSPELLIHGLGLDRLADRRPVALAAPGCPERAGLLGGPRSGAGLAGRGARLQRVLGPSAADP
ncbi:MAG: hypothetical protein ACRD0K_23730 [Egibacteraceae bacterium]